MTQIKKRVIIVGAGLSGSFVAKQLIENFEIVVIEMGNSQPLLSDRVNDIGRPAKVHPHITSGLGGTTQLWHNGLIEIHENIFKKKWPFTKDKIVPYYEIAWNILGKVSRDDVYKKAKELKEKYLEFGFNEEIFGEPLFYPKTRLNVWNVLSLSNYVQVVKGEVFDFELADNGDISAVILNMNKNNEPISIKGEIFVLAAGGLRTPLLLNKLNNLSKNSKLKLAGNYYEDHPSGMVAEVLLMKPLYKLWNYPFNGSNLRLPLIIWNKNLQISFQFKPSSHFKNMRGRNQIKSILSELRNNPFSLKLLLKLLSNFDDILEILSFKFGLNFPTRRYQIFMSSEQSPTNFQAILEKNNSPIFFRKWDISESDTEAYKNALKILQEKINFLLRSMHIFDDWKENLFSSAHHSGTARMSNNLQNGHTDSDGKVFGFNNLYISDGSAIPSSGFANTGLTIAAISIRLGQYILKKYK